ncbi:MAG: hypothetical protein PUC88_06825 [Clostridia bacterium]|nr:hypothetical protein [Clostridia bacterium]
MYTKFIGLIYTVFLDKMIFKYEQGKIRNEHYQTKTKPTEIIRFK